MYIEDYFDIVNTGERLYSVILDENELRMFDEISSEEKSQEVVPFSNKKNKKKKLLKDAAIVGAGLVGGYLGGKYIAKNWLQSRKLHLKEVHRG